jgi:hypothetical protein
MRKWIRWAVLAAVVILIGLWHWVGVVLAAVGLLLLVRWVIGRFPLRDCRSCHGTKGHRDFIWFGAFGKCHTCNGSGVRPRPAVVAFMPETASLIRRGAHGRHY